MDDILIKRREAFFNTLVLLGLDKVTFERKHGILFHKNMFILPNKKGYEIVTHFLFSKLSAVTGKDYNLPWPLLGKEHDRTFQKTCYSHLMIFSEENIVKFPRIIPSLISTFGGDRFYEVYLAFSSYVLSKTLRNSNSILLSRPTITQENLAAAKHNLQLSSILCVQKFRDTEKFTHDSHLIWITFSKNLQEYLHKLKQLLDSNEASIKEKHKIIFSLYSCEDFTLKEMMEKCFECWKPELKQRKSLEFFFSAEKKFWNYIASEVGENIENECLNGQDYNICIADNLPEECREKLEKVGFTSSLEDGKLSVVRFMKLFMAYLMYITELLNENDLQNTSCVQNATSLQDDLSSAKDLHEKLNEELIPLIKENIKKQKLVHCFDDPNEEIKMCTLLPVLSFHPDKVKERASQFDTEFLHKEIKFCSQNSDDSVFMSEKKSSSELSFMNLNHISTFDSQFLVQDVAKPVHNTKLFTRNDDGISLDKRHSRKFNAHFSNFRDEDSKLNISALDDIDFVPSNHFKMRNSWLNEESLNTVTLPDISFDE